MTYPCVWEDSAATGILGSSVHPCHGPPTPVSSVPAYRGAVRVNVAVFLILHAIVVAGRDSAVGIATDYGQDGPRIPVWGGGISCTRPDWPWGPPSPLYNGYRVFSWG